MAIADRKEREFKRREEEILAAAYGLFLKSGLETVTIEMIAEAAEIGKGTIYKHFKSKHDIFASLAIGSSEWMIRAMQERIDPAAPVLEQLKQLIRVVWDKFMSDPAGYYLLSKCEHILAMEQLSPEIAERVNRKHEYAMQFVDGLLGRGIKEGIIRDEPIEHLYLIGYGLIIGTIDLMQDTEIEDPERLYALMESVIIKGMMKY